MLRRASLLLVLCESCGRDDPKAALPKAPPPISNTEPAPEDAGTPRAPAAMPSDMALIPEKGGVDAFYLDSTEVTVQAYQECVRRGACVAPSTAPGCDGLPNNYVNKRSLHPVNCVTGVDAWKYCRFRDKRLPTGLELMAAVEDERGAMNPWGTSDPTCAQAVLAGCGDAGTSPVGSKPAGRTKQGVLDLVGNVDEIHGTRGEPYDAIPRYEAGADAYVRSSGGSYATKPQNASFTPGPQVPSPQVGFRCASSLPGQPQIGRN